MNEQIQEAIDKAVRESKESLAKKLGESVILSSNDMINVINEWSQE